ncbi:MAG: M28 family peptidase [Bacteroidetes bacterium]|nr:M28 family peptidase [Bacteroidota bacterium]
MLKTKHLFALAAIFTSIIFVSCGDGKPGGTDKDPDSIPKVEPFKAIAPEFSADTAYRFIEQQLAFGPRIPNTPAHVACAEWMVNQFKAYGAETMVQAAEIKDRSGKLIQMKNIIASYNPAATKRVMLTAHWDSRPFADKDGKNPSAPVPGANDGASGVAVILEVARQFHIKAPTVGVDLILWDAEDNGSYNDNESWCQGSQYWVNHPHKAGYRAAWGINLDMVGARMPALPRTPTASKVHAAKRTMSGASPRNWATATTSAAPIPTLPRSTTIISSSKEREPRWSR